MTETNYGGRGDAGERLPAGSAARHALVREVGDGELMLNPNGPLLNGGSDGDSGHTGRKLVMDYYGPRVPIGGRGVGGEGSNAH